MFETTTQNSSKRFYDLHMLHPSCFSFPVFTKHFKTGKWIDQNGLKLDMFHSNFNQVIQHHQKTRWSTRKGHKNSANKQRNLELWATCLRESDWWHGNGRNESSTKQNSPRTNTLKSSPIQTTLCLKLTQHDNRKKWAFLEMYFLLNNLGVSIAMLIYSSVTDVKHPLFCFWKHWQHKHFVDLLSFASSQLRKKIPCFWWLLKISPRATPMSNIETTSEEDIDFSNVLWFLKLPIIIGDISCLLPKTTATVDNEVKGY